MTTARRDAERNRRKVIEAATRLLGRDPSASLLEISQASGVGRTTLYRHFSDRNALVDSVLEEVIDRARERAIAVQADPEDPVHAIRALSEVHLETALLMGPLIQARDGASPVIEATKESEKGPTRVFLAAARRAGTIRTDQPLTWQQTVMRVVILTAVDRVRDGVAIEDAQLLVADTLVSILVPPGS